MVKKTLKIYASLRLLSLFFMGIVYANQDHEDFRDDMTDHRQVMVAPIKSSKNNTNSSLSTSPTKEQKKRPVRVIAFDGGGTRGLGSMEMADILQKALGKNLTDVFDVIVGTSTGGLQAVGLGAGLSPEKIKDIYRNESSEIFKSNGWTQWLLGGIWGSNYSTNGLEKTVQKYLGNKKMSDLKTHIGITTYDDHEGQPHLLTNQTPMEDKINYKNFELPAGNLNLFNALKATSAAPTYFPKAVISEGDMLGHPTFTGSVHQYVDGGVSANNPALLAKAFAKNLIRQGVFDETYNHEIQLVSIGTGHEQPIVYNEKAGVFGFGNPGNIPTYFMDAAEAATHATLSAEMEEGKDYFRLQFALPHKFPLDTTAPAALEFIRQKAHAATETPYFQKMVQVLCGKSIFEIQEPGAQNFLSADFSKKPSIAAMGI